MLNNHLAILRTGFLFFLFSGIISPASAQKQSYPKGYYQFPIRPGLSNSLAGGLGDLRTNHFHAGVDIRTQQVEGLPVYAAAEGYVFKVAVQRSGYGNVIYLRHPNGQTTVYGHLQKFSDSLAAYVRNEQYKKQTFEIDLFPEPGKYAFRKGELIALSGNTGGSAGPHLHFEIRDSRDNYLNPLFFGFNEIKDVTPPKFVALAVRPLDINGRVNGKFDRQAYSPVRQKDGTFVIPATITASGMIGLELMAHDMMTGTGFRYGLQCIEIKMDDNEVFAYNMEIFPNAATRDYNNLIDYETEQETGQRYLKCYVPDGNVFNLYKTGAYKGKIFIADTLVHQVKIKVFDSYENSSVLVFKIKGETESQPLPLYDTEVKPEWIQTEISGNTLKVRAKYYRSPLPLATFYVDGKEVKKSPDLYENESAVFLADLREYMPDSVQIGNTMARTYLRAKISPGRIASYKGNRWSIDFQETSLFDTLYITGQQNYNALTVNDKGTPLRDNITITFRPEETPANKDRSGIYRYTGYSYRYLGGVWKGDEITFKTKELGTFVIQKDTIPPRVRLVEHSKKRVRAYIGDGMSGIDRFTALINDQWILMNYEAKTGLIWSEKLDETQLFEGELTLEVTDGAGNSTILQTDLVEPVIAPKKRKRK
ncbi:Peptidase family M23 [Dyadobacter koreensis]|uniref:Peptidase family M23 n=1 Tax=Dyadobacter koreensis TaxID=408657 RepID=A0A1H6Z4Y7_9BACT|nr:M23 family metallopeptidase [Dyadobacter koreensis]SEJ47064.1 Peptidase family M23 [Dyadobacter koreensis]